MFLHLAADVLGQLMDRVGHLGGGLVSAKGDALQSQGGLGHLAVLDRRIALLVDLDVEGCQLRNLFADAAESFGHVTPKLVRHLDVAPAYLDPHLASFFAG